MITYNNINVKQDILTPTQARFFICLEYLDLNNLENIELISLATEVDPSLLSNIFSSEHLMKIADYIEAIEKKLCSIIQNDEYIEDNTSENLFSLKIMNSKYYKLEFLVFRLNMYSKQIRFYNCN